MLFALGEIPRGFNLTQVFVYPWFLCIIEQSSPTCPSLVLFALGERVVFYLRQFASSLHVMALFFCFKLQISCASQLKAKAALLSLESSILKARQKKLHASCHILRRCFSRKRLKVGVGGWVCLCEAWWVHYPKTFRHNRDQHYLCSNVDDRSACKSCILVGSRLVRAMKKSVAYKKTKKNKQKRLFYTSRDHHTCIADWENTPYRKYEGLRTSTGAARTWETGSLEIQSQSFWKIRNWSIE